MNEANVPSSRNSPDNRLASPKRPKSSASKKTSFRTTPKKEARGKQAASDSSQPASHPATQRPASVPGWQVVEFPSVISPTAKPQSPPRPDVQQPDSEEVRSPTVQPPQFSQMPEPPAHSSPPVQPPAPEALIALIQDANQRNHLLLNRITELEGALEESRHALQSEMDRVFGDEDEAIATSSNGEAAQQVNYLLNQLEFVQQTTQRQEILIETLTEQLQTSQERVSQIERDYQGLQAQTQESTDEVQQARGRCRELQARLQRQQRYTLQFKAALEKCLEVPPPSYETSFTASAVQDSPSNTEEASTEQVTESAASDSNPLSNPTIPFPILPTERSDFSETTASDLSENAIAPEKDMDELSNAAGSERTADRIAEALPQSQEPQASPLPSSELGIRMPSLFPKTAQIRPWSATDADPERSSEEIVGHSSLDRELESEVSVDNDSERSPQREGDRPSKFYETLLGLASLDFAEVPQPSVDTPSEDSSQEISEISADQLEDQPEQSSHSERSDRSVQQELDLPTTPKFEPSSDDQADPVNNEPPVIEIPDASAVARRRMQSQPITGLVLPPDLRKERQTAEPQTKPSNEDNPGISTGISEDEAPSVDSSHSSNSVDFPASFSIVQPPVDKQETVENGFSKADAQRLGSDDVASEAKNLDSLWRDLANLVDASTDDILKAKQTEAFEPSIAEPNRLSEPNAGHSGEETEEAIAKNSIPPFSVSPSDSERTTAALSSLVQQSSLADPMPDLWLDPESDTTSNDESTPEVTDASSTESPAAENLEPQDASTSDSSESEISSTESQPQVESEQPQSQEAKLPSLNSHHVDDWVSQPSPSTAASTNESTANVDTDSQGKPSSQPNWPAPLLDPERMKQKKSSSSVDLPAFLR